MSFGWLRVCALGLVVVAVAACGSSSSSKTTATTGTGTATGSSGGSTPSISTSSFTNDFSAMAALKSLAPEGKGKVAALLPDTTSSTRYVEFDAPDLHKALAAAGLSGSDIIVQNALGSDSTQFSQAQSDVTKGATVLMVDPLDSGVGARIEAYAKSHGVAVINYDRLTLGGSRQYYVSFNNVLVGHTMGQGLVTCMSAWKVTKPDVLVMHGAVTDNNATLFYQGYYNQIMQPLFTAGKWKDAGHPAGTWDPPTALTSFEAAFTKNKNINAALIPNDENAAPIITYLKTQGVKPKTFPTTGQDATLTGLQNVLAGYQCGTVYKPIYLEAQAATALAMYVRAGKTAPHSLVNGSTLDTQNHTSVPSVLETPIWVTPANMSTTVVKDKFVPTAQLCTGAAHAGCAAAGIS
ncbi:MAG: substrate-binding domain-containing protein [Solirubrobacterales bacterium]|nr:substrate-binding domain-containing protein [Solirubrobacterales bacterium]